MNEVHLNLGGGSILQAANRSVSQMMSYLIETASGKIIMIDGGDYNAQDAEYLYELLSEKGKTVDLWVITHAHKDHFGALAWMLETREYFDINIRKMCFQFPPLTWIKKVEEVSLPYAEKFLEGLKNQGIDVEEVHTGDILLVDDVRMEILHDASGYENYVEVNDTSLVIRLSFPKQDILFLGDLGDCAGPYVLQSCDPEKLRCDIVQMAHHGQNGVGKYFYETIMPKVCLYTAPMWLWENDIGKGRGSGPYKTLETRSWMEELGRELDCPVAYGDYLFY